MILQIPPELHPTILTYLRATDLSSLQQTCRTFSNRTLIQEVIQIFASTIYPPELTKGYDTPAISGELPSTYEEKPSYEILRNMEMLIVARVLSRPEPPLNERSQGCFYVSKAWCKAALKWLDVVEEQRKERFKLKIEAAKEMADDSGGGSASAKKKHVKKKKQTKKMKKQERRRNRKLSDTSPPWPNVNDDLICEHGFLKRSACTVIGSNDGGNSNNNANRLSSPGGGNGSSSSSRSSRAKRRLMDKQAWKVLKKLYPEGIQLSSLQGECIQCTMEAEAKKRNIEMKKQKETEERKKPLQNSHVRKFYSRSSRGVPKDCLKFAEGEYENKFAVNVNPMKKFEISGSRRSGGSSSKIGSCPLVPGVYYILPRAWCHKWRKYIKTGEGSRPCAPDSSSCLCDAHRLPLIPPHLEAFLYGDTSSLLGTGIDLMSSDCTHLLDGSGSGESSFSFGSPVAAATTASSSSNIMTIHDLNNASTPVRTTSAPASVSASSSTPRPLPIGFNPVDQMLGGSGRRSRSNSHSSFSSPTPDNNGRRSRSGSHANMTSAIASSSSSSTTISDQPRNHSGGQSRSNSQTSSSIMGVATLPQSTQQQQQLFDSEMVSTLRASGLTESEIQLQRLAMLQIEEERQHSQQQQQQQYQQYQLQQQRMRLSRQSSQGHSSIFEPDSSFSSPNLMSPEDVRANLNAKLDYENRVVVEILTEEEYTGLEQWWPEIHSSYALKFAILENNVSCGGDMNGCDRVETEIVWTTSPCRACDATGYHSNHDFVVRNRSRNWVNQSNQKPSYKKKRH